VTNMPSNSVTEQVTKESLLLLVHHFLGDIMKTSLVNSKFSFLWKWNAHTVKLGRSHLASVKD